MTELSYFLICIVISVNVAPRSYISGLKSAWVNVALVRTDKSAGKLGTILRQLRGMFPGLHMVSSNSAGLETSLEPIFNPNWNLQRKKKFETQFLQTKTQMTTCISLFVCGKRNQQVVFLRSYVKVHNICDSSVTFFVLPAPTSSS